MKPNADRMNAIYMLNEYHMQIAFILSASGFIGLQDTGFKWLLAYKNVVHNVVFYPYIPFIIGDTEGHDRLCGHYTARKDQTTIPCLRMSHGDDWLFEI